MSIFEVQRRLEVKRLSIPEPVNFWDTHVPG